MCAKGWREGRWSRRNIYLNADHSSVFETTFALPLIIIFKNYPNHLICWVQNLIFVKKKLYFLNNWYKRQKLSMITNVNLGTTYLKCFLNNFKCLQYTSFIHLTRFDNKTTITFYVLQRLKFVCQPCNLSQTILFVNVTFDCFRSWAGSTHFGPIPTLQQGESKNN